MAKKRGRKCLYNTLIKPNLPLIQEMCKSMTEQQIAEQMGVAYSTWNKYKEDFPELMEVLKKGRQNLVAELRSTLLKKAKGYEYIETKEIVSHVRWPEEMYEALTEAGFTTEQIESARLVKTETAHKQMHPDVAALNLALKNYDKDNWSNDPQMQRIREKELELRERQIENNEW